MTLRRPTGMQWTTRQLADAGCSWLPAAATALLNPSACANRYTTNYLISGALPPVGARCRQDARPLRSPDCVGHRRLGRPESTVRDRAIRSSYAEQAGVSRSSSVTCEDLRRCCGLKLPAAPGHSRPPRRAGTMII